MSATAPRSEGAWEIREAGGDHERAAIFRLRYEIYVEEMKREQRHALHHHRQVVEPLDGTAFLLGAWREGRLGGTCRINFSASSRFENREVYGFDEFEGEFPRGVAFITKMMVRPELRNGRLFVELSKAVYRACAERGCGVMVIDCNDHLVSSFERQGFRAYRGKMHHPEFGPVTPMVLHVRDLAHLEKVRSPFLPIARALFSSHDPQPTSKGNTVTHPTSSQGSMFEIIKAEWKEYFSSMSKTEGVRRLESGEITVEHYKSILKQIYFHTRENPQVQAMATGYFRGHQRELVKAFYQHAISEIGHDRLALNDLETLGEDVGAIPSQQPLAATMALISYPFYLIQFMNPVAYLGYLFHLEFMPTQNGHRYMDVLERIGVPREAMTFIEEHATVDVAHNKLMERYIRELVRTEDDLEAVISAAKTTARLYSSFLLEAMEAAERPEAAAGNSAERSRRGLSREALTPPAPHPVPAL